MEDYIPDQKSLSIVSIWILIALSEKPGHVYGLQGRIYGASLSYASPNLSTIKSSVRSLMAGGLVEEVGMEPARASGHERKLFCITKSGLRALYHEEIALGMARQGIKRALAQSVLRSSGGGPIPARRG
jgi:DNA-binding PadR family transcriptional regulator